MVLSADPDATEASYGVKAVHRMRPCEVLPTLRKADLLISGGGSLLQDVTSGRSIIYYLGLIWLARRFGKRTMIFAQGIGPINSRSMRTLTRKVLNQVDLITVRDAASRTYLRKLGVDRPESRVTADPSFAVPPAPEEEAEELLTAAGAPSNVPLIGVALRPWQEHPNWLPAIVRGLDSAAARLGAGIVFLPMQRDHDLTMAVRVAADMSVPSAVISSQLTPAQVLAIIGRMSLVVGMRLHALIFAASMDVPFIGISYDPKVDAFVHAATSSDPLKLDGLTAADVAGRVIDAWENRSKIVRTAQERVRRYREAALENVALACDLINA